MMKKLVAMLLMLMLCVGLAVTASAATTYTVTIDSAITGGTVTADKNEAAAGDTVTLTAVPANGYELSKYTVTDANGTPVTVTNGVFTMPEGNVTVAAEFKITSRSIIFYANNGTDQTYVLNKSTTSSLPTAEECGFTAPEGKVLKGWALNSVTGSMKLPGWQNYSISGGRALYAIWTDPVASVTIGGTTTSYGNLIHAFSAADGKTATITLLSDWDNSLFAEHPQIKLRASKVTFDLNGHKISNSNSSESNALEFNGECVIKNGEIEFTGGGQYIRFYSSAKNSKLTINGDVKITNTNPYGNAVLVSGGANTVIVESGAEIAVPNKSNTDKTGAITLYKDATLIVNGGTISSSGSKDTDIAAYSTSNTNTTVVVNGGSFDTVKADNVYFNVDHAAIVTANVTGNAWYKLTNGISAEVAAVTYGTNTTTYDGNVYGLGGADVTITAVPNTGYTVDIVKANETEATKSGNDFTFAMPKVLVTLTAEAGSAAPTVYSVTASANPAEGGTVSGAGEYAEGDTVTLTATANDGYRFKEWQVVSGGAAIDNNQFTMSGNDVEVKAVFERVYKVIIAQDIQNGTLEADKYVAAAGETVILSATPATGYTKGQYKTTLHGEGAIGLSGDTLTMPACDVTVSVTFLPINTHTVSKTSQAGLTVRSSSHPYDKVPDGETYTFTVETWDGYEKTNSFAVTANGLPITPDADGVYSIPNVTANQVILVWGVFPCKPDAAEDFKDGSNYPFTLVCEDNAEHTYTAPYYNSEYITNISAVYGNVNSADGWRCDVTFDVEKYAAANNHRITTQMTATASFTLKWDTSTKKWAYVNETVTYDITCAPTLTGIAVTTQPKLDYSEGDALDLSAMVIMASWSDNSTTELGYADVTASIANGTTLAKAAHNGEVITVTYNGQTAQTNALSVKSGNTSVSAVEVKSVAGTIEGNAISVVLPYGNNLADLTSDDFTVTLADFAANVTAQPASNDGGTTWLFTVTAENGTTQVYTVNVSIGEDPDAPDKTDVSTIKLAISNHNWTVAQETANTSEAMKAWIEATLANSNLNGVTASEVTITAITPAVAGDMYNLTGTNGSFCFTVKLSKGNVTDTVEITTGVITATAYSGNAFVPVTDITGVPTSTTAGTPLTLTGIVEPGNATYTTIAWSVKDAGTTGAAISDNTLTATTAGDVIVTATIANGKSATEAFTKDFTITVRPAPVVLTGIVVTTAPTKTVYTEGEFFNPAGMVVTANYSDGSSKAVTGYALSPNGALTTANTTVTVTYMENGITKTASQVISVNAKPAATYTVTFDSNGGSGTMVPQTFTEGVAQNLTLNAFTREGFTFIGWNTAADGSSNSFADGASVTASGNATLYAQWQKNAAAVYTVTVSNDGNGTGTAVPSSGVTGTEVEITVTPNSGYRFKEWQVISGDVTVTGNKLTIGTANVEVKAIFELIPAATYTVTFDPNGGSGMMAPQTFTEGVAQNLTLNTFTREGFTFNGWNTTADGSGTSFADGASVTASSNATLYAQWKAVPAVTPLTITKQPTDQFVVEGQRAEFSVEATGDGLSYQWYINRNDGRGWRELDGAIGTAYVTSVTDLECDGFQYGCLITDQYGNILKSDVAVLHVSKVPVLPETGDSSTPMLWLAMSILSMAGILLLRKKAYSR